jgi:DNA-binding XRE family transcriptional regulator
LRRQVAKLERLVAVLQRQRPGRFARRGGERVRPQDALRRERPQVAARALGLSAAEYGKLVGVTAQSVYNWERGGATPRGDQLARIASLRAIGKRECDGATRAGGGRRTRPGADAARSSVVALCDSAHTPAAERRRGGARRLRLRSTERSSMKIPVETKPALWGMAGGAIAAAVIGFGWGGWVTGGRAESDAMQRTNAPSSPRSRRCASSGSRPRPPVATNLIELKKADSWSRGDYVEKGGWASAPGKPPSDQVSAIARACAVLLAPS